MRTSFNKNTLTGEPKAVEEKVQEKENGYSVQQSAKESIVNGYSSLEVPVQVEEEPVKVEEVAVKNETAVENETAPEKSSKKKHTKEKPTKKKSHKTLIVVIILLAVIAVAVYFASKSGYITFGKQPEPTEPPTEAYEPQVQVIKEEVDGLYLEGVSEELTLEVLDDYYARLREASFHGEDTSEVEDTLDCLASYIEDNASLKVFEAEGYDLAPDTVLSDMLKLKAYADKYCIQSLKEDIYSRTDTLLAMREEYLRLKDSMLGVSDLLTFDRTQYEASINAISHSRNREELLLILNKVSADSDVVKAEAALESAEDKEAAQKAIDDAKVKQTEAIKALEEFNGARLG